MTNRLTTARRALTVAALCAVPALLVGCGTSAHAGNERAIRSNPSPELRQASMSRQEEYNAWAYMQKTNYEHYRTDLARALYIDRPSRLHFGPKP